MAIICSFMRGDSGRAWEICGVISILLHGLALGVLALTMPPNFATPPDPGVTIDLDLVATGMPQPEALPASAAAPPEPPQVAAKTVEPMPVPKKSEAPNPKPVPKKAFPRKQEQPRKIAATNARSQGQKAAGSDAPGAETAAKSAAAPAAPPAPLGGSSSPLPPYPELARKRGQEGTVNIRCQVDAHGKVTAVSIAKSSGFKLLDDAALKAVGKWKFRAGSRDGANIAGTVVVPVQFRLK